MPLHFFISCLIPRSFIRTCIALVLAGLLGGCTTAVTQQTTFNETVWDVAANHAITAEQLVERLRTADFALLGETHDNPAHHRIQNALLNSLSNNGSAPTLVMEQYDLEQQALVDVAMASVTHRAASLDQLMHLMPAGWDWPQYQVLLETAKDRRLSVVAANLSRTRLQQVSRQGFAALGPGEAARLVLDAGWSDAQQTQLEKDIVDGHCGMLPAKAAAAVARAQRARDAMMADALLSVHSGIAVGILGREHVRRDLSVPLYLAARAPNRNVVVIGLIDSDGSRAPHDEATGKLGPRYDYLVLTAPMQRTVDPCDGLVMPIAAPN